MQVRLHISKWIVNPILGLLITLGTNNSIFTYMALLLSVASIVLYNEQDSLCVLLFTLSFTFLFKTSPSSTSLFTVLLLFYVAWNFINTKVFDRIVGYIIVLVAYTAVVHFANGMMQITQLMKFAVNLLFLYFALDTVNYNHPKEVCMSYIAGVVFSSLLKLSGLFPNVPMYTTEDDPYRFTGFYQDPNYYSVNVILAMCIIVVLFHRKDLSAVPSLFLIGLLTYFSTLTQSKSALLMLILPMLMLALSVWKKKNSMLYVGFIVIVLMFIWLYRNGKINIFDKTLNRFDEISGVDDLTTGRIGHWKDHFDVMSESLFTVLFGVGLNNMSLTKGVPHNTYFDVVFNLGLIGSIIWLRIIFYLVERVHKKINRSFLNYGGWICVFVMYFFLSEFLYFDYPFHILICCIMFNRKLNLHNAKM